MNIIGLHNDADSGVCLMVDGEIVEAVNEERFSRDKLFSGFPDRCLRYVLDKHGMTLADVDYFVYGWYGRQNDYPRYIQKLTARLLEALKKTPQAAEVIAQRVNSEFDQDEATRFEFEQHMRGLGVDESCVIYLDHHASHAWSAFATSPFDEAFVFTFDGRGDLKAASASFASIENGITEYDSLLSFDSLGFLYGQITDYLGFKFHRHEGKVTGLAALGNPKRTLHIFQELISWNGHSIVSDLGKYKPFYTNRYPELDAKLSMHSREDIAAGLQDHCEFLVVQYASHWIQEIAKPHVRNVCLAGGLFGNVKINQRVLEIQGVDNIYVFPHMGDGGLSVGAACQLRHRLTGQAKVRLDTAYMGPEYDDDQILEALSEAGENVIWTKMDDLVEQTVNDLIAEKVVGFFQNRMEFGPRALGARSILYHTRDRSVNTWLNDRLRRTEFMPFAPVTPEEYATECYMNWRPELKCAQLMTLTFDCKKEFANRHPAVVHVDGTARPQVVTERLHGDYYHVVKGYCDRTGEQALINTSFNAHEEPIVCSPKDAIESIQQGMVDVLMIGSYRVVRLEQ